MRSPRSLAWRLVVTTVALVAVAALLMGGATALAMRDYLTDQLDDRVERGLDRTVAALTEDGPGPHGPGRGSGRDEDGPGRGPGLGQDVGTVWAVYLDSGDRGGSRISTTTEGAPISTALDDDLLDELAKVDGAPRSVDLGGLGGYRTAAEDVEGGRVVYALPSDEVDRTLRSLVGWEAVLGLLAVAAAAVLGLLVVRRQLRPLNEVASTAHAVAALPLASGEIHLTERVPERLTDARTEVGQVGAALNTLLDHVESALADRQHSEQQVRQFVADASHELRTPLATIAGYAELARRRPDDAAAARTALAKVEEESRRMTSLVEDLLLLARLDSGRPLERTPVDLTRLLLEAVADAQVVAPEHRWRLELPAESVEVLGDEHRLHQVVTNLLTNARKHTPAGTTVTVTAYRGADPGGTGFAVHDDGPGFPPELAGRAFERFVRGDASRNRAGGVGLGLALVQAIVSAHGGRVELTSRPGDTTVRVSLPPAAPR